MKGRGNQTDYDDATTTLCERSLVTLLGDLGPWRERIYLVGGLAPKYLVGRLPEGAASHAGTGDVDLIIGLALGSDTPETYRTLKNNLVQAGFVQATPSFRWNRKVAEDTVIVEFLCETDAVAPGTIYRPRNEGSGSGFGAFNVRGAHLAQDDFIEHIIEAERLDDGGVSKVAVRIANVLPYMVLKTFAFQDRHANKDAYDLVFTLLNYEGGPRVAGRSAAESVVAVHPQVEEALILLAERFADLRQDGPFAYSAFLATIRDEGQEAQRRQESVAVIRDFLTGFREAG